MKSLGPVLIIAACVACATAAKGQAIAQTVKGKLVALNGTVAVPQNDKSFGEPKYVALYFSAGWCGPCHKFTPDLISFYKEMKPKHPEFEVVLMSEDYSAPEMQQYMAEAKMPWPALRWDAIKFTSALNKWAGPGIPDLVVLDANGQVLSNSFENGKYVGPGKVLNDLRKILEGGTPAVAAAATAPAKGAAPSPAASGTPASPSGTKWDDIFKKRSP